MGSNLMVPAQHFQHFCDILRKESKLETSNIDIDMDFTDLALHQPENNEENYPLTKFSLITDHKGR